MNKRGKKARKVKDVKKIAISFTIVKNITAKTGNKTIYVRIAKPNNEILSKVIQHSNMKIARLLIQ